MKIIWINTNTKNTNENTLDKNKYKNTNENTNLGGCRVQCHMDSVYGATGSIVKRKKKSDTYMELWMVI